MTIILMGLIRRLLGVPSPSKLVDAEARAAWHQIDPTIAVNVPPHLTAEHILRMRDAANRGYRKRIPLDEWKRGPR